MLPAIKLINFSMRMLLDVKYLNTLVESPKTRTGILWPIAKLINTNPEYSKDSFMTTKLPMIISAAPQAGHAGVSINAKSIPNMNAEWYVVVRFIAVSQRS